MFQWKDQLQLTHRARVNHWRQQLHANCIEEKCPKSAPTTQCNLHQSCNLTFGTSSSIQLASRAHLTICENSVQLAPACNTISGRNNSVQLDPGCKSIHLAPRIHTTSGRNDSIQHAPMAHLFNLPLLPTSPLAPATPNNQRATLHVARTTLHSQCLVLHSPAWTTPKDLYWVHYSPISANNIQMHYYSNMAHLIHLY